MADKRFITLAIIGHKTKRAKWVMVGWDERLLVSEG